MATERKSIAPTVELSDENSEAIIGSCTQLLTWLVHDAIRGNHEAKRRLQKIQALLASSGMYSDLTPSIQRALELTVLQNQLSKIVFVQPRKPGGSQAGDPKQQTIILDERRKTSPLYKEAKRSFKSRTTLNALSMRMYIARLSEQGIHTIDQRVLIRDLNALAQWRKNYQIVFLGDKVFAEPHDTTEPRTLPIRTSSWRQRVHVDKKHKH